jgi:hypothetical protein
VVDEQDEDQMLFDMANLLDPANNNNNNTTINNNSTSNNISNNNFEQFFTPWEL